MPIRRAICWEPVLHDDPVYCKAADRIDMGNDAATEATGTIANQTDSSYWPGVVMVKAWTGDPLNDADLADLMINGPYTSAVITWINTWATAVNAAGHKIYEMYFDFEEGIGWSALFGGMTGAQRQTKIEEIYNNATALARLPKHLQDLGAAAYNTGANSTKNDHNDFYNGVFRSIVIRRIIAEAESIFGNKIKVGNYRDQVAAFRTMNVSNTLTDEISSLSNVSCPVLYWTQGGTRYSGLPMVKHTRWGSWQDALNRARACKRAGSEVVPWVDNFFRNSINSSTYTGETRWNIEQVKHLAAMEITDLLYFNNHNPVASEYRSLVDQHMEDVCRATQSIVVKPDPLLELLRADFDRDTVRTGSYETEYDAIIPYLAAA